MTIQKKVGFALVGAALLLFAGHGWLQERDARLKAELLSNDQQKQLAGLKQQAATTQEALASKVASIERERSQPVTAAQVVRDTGALIPNLPQAIEVQEVASTLPNAPATEAIVVPAADFRSIRDAQLTCEEDSVKLTACQTLQEDGKQQLTLTEAQRDEWKSAAKGGTAWHRALGAAKWFAVGAASGAVVYAAGHHR